jgi:hypothetical protein
MISRLKKSMPSKYWSCPTIFSFVTISVCGTVLPVSISPRRKKTVASTKIVTKTRLSIRVSPALLLLAVHFRLSSDHPARSCQHVGLNRHADLFGPKHPRMCMVTAICQSCAFAVSRLGFRVLSSESRIYTKISGVKTKLATVAFPPQPYGTSRANCMGRERGPNTL